MDPSLAGSNTFDWFVENVQAQLKAKQDAAKAAQDKATEAKYKQMGDAAKALQDLSSLLQGKAMPAEQKKAALKAALGTLVKSLSGTYTEDGQIPDEIVSAIEALADPDPTHKKQWDDALKALKHWLAKVVVSNTSIVNFLNINLVASGADKAKSAKDKAGDALKGVDDLVAKVDTLVKVLCGNATEAEREKILADSFTDLLTSAVVIEQIKWFVTENALTYGQAVKLGYQLGAPIGNAIAKDLTTISGIQLGNSVLIALGSKWISQNGQAGDGSWVDAAAGGDRPTVTLTGALSGWKAIAYYDAVAKDIRIVCVGPQTIVLDGNGRVVVDAPPPSTAGEPSSVVADDGTGDRPAAAFKTAVAKTQQLEKDMHAAEESFAASQAVWKELEGEVVTARREIGVLNARIHDALHPVVTKATYGLPKPNIAQLRRDLAARLDQLADLSLKQPAAQAAYAMAFSAMTLKRDAYWSAIKQWLIKAATAEAWSDADITYAAYHYPKAAFSRSEVPSVIGAAGAGLPRGLYATVALSHVLISYIRRSRAAQATLVVATLAGAALGLQLQGAGAGVTGRPAVGQPSLPAAVATSARTAPATVAALDVCTLVTNAEASTLLEKPVTSLTASANQCVYRPAEAAGFTFSQGSFTVTRVTLQVITGSDAARRFSAAEALFGRDPQDQRVSDLGDRAIITRGTVLSVLQGDVYVEVNPQGSISWNVSSTQIKGVPEKWLSIVEGFARPALARASSAAAARTEAPAATPAATRTATPTAAPTRTAAPATAAPATAAPATAAPPATPSPTPTGSDIPTPKPSPTATAVVAAISPLPEPTPTPSPSPTVAGAATTAGQGPNAAGGLLGGAAGLALGAMAVLGMALRRR